MATTTESGAGKVPLPSSRRGVKGFMAETGRELRKVNWPSAQETTRLTGVVLTVCLAQGLMLLGMGYVFNTIIDILMKGHA